MKHICFCADQNYLRLVEGVVRSIMASNSAAFAYHLITDEDTFSSFGSILDRVQRVASLTVHLCAPSEFDDLHPQAHLTRAAYYRLLIPRFVRADVVLYLDLDLLVSGDISTLFGLDLKENYLAAVTNPFFRRWDTLQISPEWGYFNSGVLLLNLVQWRAENLPGRALDFLREKGKLALMADQDALNYVCQGRWLQLPIRFNSQTIMYMRIFSRELSMAEKRDLLNPVVIHYSTKSKPWSKSDMHPYKRRHRVYGDSFPAEEFTVVDFLKLIRNFFRQWLPFHAWLCFTRIFARRSLT